MEWARNNCPFQTQKRRSRSNLMRECEMRWRRWQHCIGTTTLLSQIFHRHTASRDTLLVELLAIRLGESPTLAKSLVMA